MELNEKEKSELKKISGLSSKNAADALSKMINKEVKVDFSNLTLHPLDEINKLTDDMIISLSEITGDVNGNILMAFLKDKGLSLLDMMMFRDVGTLNDMNEEAKGAFNELTNIVGGAYVSALANYLSFKIFPSPPKFVGNLEVVQDELIKELEENVGNILLINTVLSVESINVQGTFFLMLDDESLNKMLKLLNAK